MNTLKKGAVALLPAIVLLAVLMQIQKPTTTISTDIRVKNITYELTP